MDVDDLRRGLGHGGDVAVAQHHALRPPRGARGVDDGRQGVRVSVPDGKGLRLPGQALAQLGDTLVGGRTFAGTPLGEQQHPLQRRGLREVRRQAAPRRRVLHQQQARAGVFQDVRDVVGPVVHIEWHRDEPETEGRLVEDHPLGGVPEGEGHPVTGV